MSRHPTYTGCRLGVRRIVFALAATGALIGGAVGCGSGDGGSRSGSVAAATSTLDSRWIDIDGNGTLERGAGEPLIDRGGELNGGETRTLATFAQITDAHVRDEESPARAPLLDRLSPRLNSTFRPQEALSVQVLEAAVESINAFGPDAVVMTGDLIDSNQRNELAEATALLNGGIVDPSSGAPRYEGPQAADNPDPFFYRPEIDAPRHPGLIDRAQQSFEAQGLDAPWYPVAGNHDLLVQGEVPETDQLQNLATGDQALVEVDPNLEVPEGITELTPEIVDAALQGGLPGKTDEITPDPDRVQLGAEQVVDRLRKETGRAAAEGGPLLDYGFDLAPGVRGIVMDLVDRSGGSNGRVLSSQLDFVRQELAAAGDREVLVFSHQPIANAEGGTALIDLLAAEDRVVAAISGHTHENQIERATTPGGDLWLIQSAALTDYPQQTRAFRLIETGDGEIALETWMLDTSDSGDAGIARDLAYLDAQGGRPRGAAGRPEDRNVRLFVG